MAEDLTTARFASKSLSYEGYASGRWEGRNRYNSGLSTYERITPKGWRFLGAGVSRAVWRDPQKVVWKIQTKERGYNDTNQMEYEAYHTLMSEIDRLSLDHLIQLPHLTQWKIGQRLLLSTPFIPRLSSPNCNCFAYKKCKRKWCCQDTEERFNDAFEALNLVDMHPANYFVTPEGRAHIIDFAC